MRLRSLLFLGFAIPFDCLLLPTAGYAQTADSVRYRIYITVTDSITGRSARASLGFHPRATLGLDPDTLSGFTDHWYEKDSPLLVEYPSPPQGFFEELRINNYRQKFADNGLLFGNIHPYTGPSMVDTFIVTLNGDDNSAGDSLYLYTHPQILSWPSVLRYYADSIILVDVLNNGQTVPGNRVRVDLTKDSTFTYFGPNYFDFDLGIYELDPLHKGFFIYIYHPKISPGPPNAVTLQSPANGSTGVLLNGTLQWSVAPLVSSYKVELDTIRTFTHPVLAGTTTSNTVAFNGLNSNKWYYWRVLVSNPFGVSYYQNPPDSFETTSETSVNEIGRKIPHTFALLQNYPEPFNPSTFISYSVPKQTHVRLQIFNPLGQLITTLVDESKPPGTYTAAWDAGTRSSGLYFFRMTAGEFVQTKKAILLR